MLDVMGLILSAGVGGTVVSAAQPQSTDGKAAQDDIVVLGQRVDDRSILDDDVAALSILGADQIGSTGATSINELLRRLGGLTTAPGGKEPLILVNGRPVMGAADLAGLPPEAIEQLQVAAESNAPRFGGTPDRRVVNIVLQRRFVSAEIEPRSTRTTEGGGASAQGNAQLAQLAGKKRVSLNVHLLHQDELRESERSLSTGKGPDDPSRSLVTGGGSAALNGMATVPIGATTSASASWSFSQSDRRGISGPGMMLGGDAWQQRSRFGNYQATAMIVGLANRWQWHAKGNLGRSTGDTRLSDGEAGAPLQRSRSESRSMDGELRLTGSPLKLPAGPLQLAAFARYRRDRGRNVSFANGAAIMQPIGQQAADASLSLTIPITAATPARSSAIGSMSATITGGVARVSRSGPVPRWDAIMRWQPLPVVTLSAGLSIEQQPLPVQALLRPLIQTPGVPVFDYLTGNTVPATITTGGNPDIRAQRQERRTATLSVRPWKKHNLTFDLGYTDTRVHDPLLSLSSPTALVAGAFPERFGRNADGQLTTVDARAVNLFRARQREVSGGVSLFMAPSPPRPGTSAKPQVNLNLRPVLVVEDRLTLRRGGAVLDVLNGDTLNGQGGRPRFQLQGFGSIFLNGIALSVDGRTQAASRVRAERAAADLRFGALTVFNVNLTLPIGRLATGSWGEKAQATIDIRNMFNRRQIVRDRNGNIPIGFQPARLDPFGRTLGFAVRLRF